MNLNGEPQLTRLLRARYMTAALLGGGESRNAPFEFKRRAVDFSRATLICQSSHLRRFLTSQAEGRDKLPGRQRKAYWVEAEKSASEKVALEGKLVRYLARRWPTMTFDETCDFHFKLTNAE